jgi:predicted P-loop ATPase
VGAIVVVARDHAFDPVVVYLRSLAWDGVERIDLLLTRYFKGEDTPLHRAFGRCWMIGAAARAFEPGCQCDYTLIIVGAQGLRKSTAFIVLAGPPEWFTDSVPGFNDPKRFAEVIAGCWIVELAELDSVARSEMSAVKALLTARYDKYRAPWGKVAESHPRRVAFAATTNDATLFRDHTGARRFWPVAVSRVDIDALARDRDQLWAEAAARYRAGEPWHLTDPALIEAAETSQEARRAPDPWEARIEGYLSVCERAESAAAAREGRELSVLRVTMDALLGASTALDLRAERWDAASANRVARILQRLGWARTQRRDGPEGRRRWAYERKHEAAGPDGAEPGTVEP